MKILIVLGIFLFTGMISCKKREMNNDCTGVTITRIGSICSIWGLKVNGTTYPSSNIPAEFQQEGAYVCASYVLYEDMRLCVCCGGTWANIKLMKGFTK